MTVFKRLFSLSLLIVTWSSCAQTTHDLTSEDILLKEKDLIPEGVAYDDRTHTLFVGSIYRQKILAIDEHGRVTDWATQEQFGDMSPIGMEVDHAQKRLWVCAAQAPIVNQSKAEEWQTTVFAFNLQTKKLDKKYEIIQEAKSFLNDLTVTPDGDLFATETANGKIYWINHLTDQLELFVALDSFSFPNGITYYEKTNELYVATNEGIVALPLANRVERLVSAPDTINTKVIDGLAIFDNYFIGHQSSVITKFYFDESMSSITGSEIFDSGDEFDSSTTGEIGKDRYFYIVNSQIRSGINRENMTIKPLDSLDRIIIRNKPL